MTGAGEDNDGKVDVPDEACRAVAWAAATAGGSIQRGFGERREAVLRQRVEGYVSVLVETTLRGTWQHCCPCLDAVLHDARPLECLLVEQRKRVLR